MMRIIALRWRRTPALLGAILAAGALLLGLGPAVAASGPMLKGDVVAHGDALTLGDLVDNVTASSAATPLFRAPALGQSGTIQTRRIVDAALAAGVDGIETGGRLQILVTRATRQIGPQEIEAALAKSLASLAGLDPRTTGIVFDGTPTLMVPPDLDARLEATDVVYDRRSRRISALAAVGPSPDARRASTRVTGSVVEMVEVSVLTRPVARGDVVAQADVAVERRPRELVPPDAVLDGGAVAGRVARRAFQAGALVRSGDLARPELVSRGDIVSVVYETPGMALTMRARASESGSLGDTVSIVNPQSKKVLQGIIVGPGKVSASAAPTGRLASAAPEPKP